jgi:hypothetical protein
MSGSDQLEAQHQRLRLKYPTLICDHQVRANECGITTIQMIYDSWHSPKRPSAFINLATKLNVYNQHGSIFSKLGELIDKVGLVCSYCNNEDLYKHLKYLDPKSCTILLSCFNNNGQPHVIIIDDYFADGSIIIRDPAMGVLEQVNPKSDPRFVHLKQSQFYIIEPYPAGHEYDEYDEYENEFNEFNAKHSKFLDEDGQANHKLFK